MLLGSVLSPGIWYNILRGVAKVAVIINVRESLSLTSLNSRLRLIGGKTFYKPPSTSILTAIKKLDGGAVLFYPTTRGQRQPSENISLSSALLTLGGGALGFCPCVNKVD